MQNALCVYLEMMCIIVTKIYLIVGDLVRTEFGFYLPVDKKNYNFELISEGLVQNVILAHNVCRRPNDYELCKYKVGINLNEQPQILSLWGHCKCRLKNAGIPPCMLFIKTKFKTAKPGCTVILL